MDIKKTIWDYCFWCLWFMVHKNERLDIKEFEKALDRIGKLEEKLRMIGTSEDSINVLLDRMEKIADSTIDVLTSNEQLLLCQTIFGKGTGWAKA